MNAVIFAEQPLDDNALIMLCGVRVPDLNLDVLEFISERVLCLSLTLAPSFVSIIDHWKISSPFFRQQLLDLSGVQDWDLYEPRLAVLCSNTTVSSKLHFNLGNLSSSSIKNVNILRQLTRLPSLPSLRIRLNSEQTTLSGLERIGEGLRVVFNL